MKLSRDLGLAALLCGVVVLAMGLHACSDSTPAGQNTVTGTCVPGSTTCGPNAICSAGGFCACNAGFSDCNRDMGTAVGNGCECGNACAGNTCSSAACDSSTPNACGGDTSFCQGGVCNPCPGGSFNCDGVDTCEKLSACGGPVGGGCDTRVPNSCSGNTTFCDANNSCQSCGAGEFNCDGVGGCECRNSCVGSVCQAPSDCSQDCIDHLPTHCAANPAANNRCEECLSDTHCTANPRSHGPTCNTSDIAGTGFSFCVCSGDADCANRSIGSKCLVTASGTSDPNFKQCTCESDADCKIAPFVHCIGSLFKRCMKRCTSSDDCKWSGVTGYCGQDGRCDFNTGGM